jgi:endonuclease YncB( thermonuclease family)
MFRIIFTLILISICLPTLAQKTFLGNVVEVKDGNTLRVIDYDNDTINVILQGIDCPELSQKLGVEAQTYTASHCLGKNVKIQLLGRDRWGNDIANVQTPEGEDLSEKLLKSGLAWFYLKNKGEEVFAQLEEDSRNQKIGIWEQPAPLAPWIFRRQQSMLQPKRSY